MAKPIPLAPLRILRGSPEVPVTAITGRYAPINNGVRLVVETTEGGVSDETMNLLEALANDLARLVDLDARLHRVEVSRGDTDPLSA